ncbi:MAG: hypothetical protein GXY76_19400 [Chloroflexi bacterium]|nr:hypothetical protein [Chloroflexota bacterium]
MAAYCPRCGLPLVRVFWQEDGAGECGAWMGTCLNPKCAYVGSTIAAVTKAELQSAQPRTVALQREEPMPRFYDYLSRTGLVCLLAGYALDEMGRLSDRIEEIANEAERKKRGGRGGRL